MIHLKKFVERVQGAEARGLKDFTMSMTDAKSMHADLTKLFIELEILRTTPQKAPESDIITVNMDGGSFK